MDGLENKRVLEIVFAATAEGNGKPFRDALADDVRWTIIGSTAWSRTYVGKASVVNELLVPLRSRLAGPNTIKATRLLADADFVIVEAVGDNTTKEGQPYQNRYCWIVRMANGKMVELTEYADTQLIAQVLGVPGRAHGGSVG